MGPRHAAWVNDGVEALLGKGAERKARFAQAQILCAGFLCDLGSAVVADMGYERRYQHQRAFDRLFDVLPVCDESLLAAANRATISGFSPTKTWCLPYGFKRLWTVWRMHSKVNAGGTVALRRGRFS